MFNYQGKVVAITGASSGLGMQMAKGFSAQGAAVVLMARRVERLEGLANEIIAAGGDALAVALDVTDEAQIEQSLATILDKYGKVDVLVNNAGASKGGAITEMTNEAWEFTMDLDLTSVFKMTRTYAKAMKEAGYGRIINISSMYGILGTNQQESAYHASKAGVINFSRAVAAELAPFNITVNTLCPGYFDTELTADTLETDAFQGYMDVTVPMKRYGKEGELNAAAIFLGSEEAAYVTAVTLPVDGGWSATK